MSNVVKYNWESGAAAFPNRCLELLFRSCSRGVDKTDCQSWLQYTKGRSDLALMGYLRASELGYEKAQANVAWLLSHNEGIPSGQSATNFVQQGHFLSSASFP